MINWFSKSVQVLLDSEVTKLYMNVIVIFLVLGCFGEKYLNKLGPALPQWLIMMQGAMWEAIEEKE